MVHPNAHSGDFAALNVSQIDALTGLEFDGSTGLNRWPAILEFNFSPAFA
jgi:hypothetical protein